MGILLANPITTFLGFIMKWIYEVLSSVGFESTVYSIIVFTIIVYMLMLPMTIQQQKFTRISSVMNPEIQAVQAKYKGKSDQASMLKQQDELKLIYAKYGTNPTGGCLSSLIQLPILFCLWPVIQNIGEYINEVGDYNRFLFFKDVTQSPSTLINASLKPLNIGIIIAAVSIPLLSGITQWVSMKISQTTTASKKDGKQSEENQMAAQMNVMMKYMPIFSVVMCFSMPLGLGIYWVVSALVRIIQQLVINHVLNKKSIDDLVEENIKKLEKKNKNKKVDGKNVNNMATMYTRRIEEMKAEVYADAEKKEKEEQRRKEIIEKSAAKSVVTTSNGKPGSLTAKANMVRDYNNNNKN